jgi:hypothetical protein
MGLAAPKNEIRLKVLRRYSTIKVCIAPHTQAGPLVSEVRTKAKLISSTVDKQSANLDAQSSACAAAFREIAIRLDRVCSVEATIRLYCGRARSGDTRTLALTAGFMF